MMKISPRVAVILFAMAVLVAMLAPAMYRLGNLAHSEDGRFPGWPTHYEQQALTELPLSTREVAFVRDFPGRVGRFTDGRREFIIRFVSAPTRRLHSAADCFRGMGYSVTPLPAHLDKQGRVMGCLRASNRTEVLSVCEVISNERGDHWPDVSAWYWHALFGPSRAPWWSLVVAEKG
jgi:hypothetical protein